MKTLLAMAVLLLGGCHSLEDLYQEFDTNCKRVESEYCTKLENKMIALEDMKVERREVKAFLENGCGQRAMVCEFTQPNPTRWGHIKRCTCF